jgi:flagellar biosynthesis/type III secretory pathway protein FliH
MGIRKSLLLALTAVAASLGSCSAPPTELPHSSRPPEETVLGKNEVQSAVSAMIAKAKTHQSETAKQIEKGQ